LAGKAYHVPPDVQTIAVTAARILLVFQSLLAVLLLAGGPVGERLQARDGSFVHLVLSTSKALAAHRGHAAAGSPTAQDDLSGFGGADPDHLALVVQPAAWQGDPAPLLRIGRPCDILPLSYSRCAAPPIGPPSSLV
jgi:hypothetical protein